MEDICPINLMRASGQRFKCDNPVHKKAEEEARKRDERKRKRRDEADED
jgi:hypothetical protein